MKEYERIGKAETATKTETEYSYMTTTIEHYRTTSVFSWLVTSVCQELVDECPGTANTVFYTWASWGSQRGMVKMSHDVTSLTKTNAIQSHSESFRVIHLECWINMDKY